jgi:opine dehydrogenase
MMERKAEGMNQIKFAVIGAGNGGQSMAGHLAIMGFDVALHDVDEEKIERIREKGGIEVTGRVNGFGKPSAITADIEEAISGANLIMVVTDSTAHRAVAENIAPYLADGQIIVLNPGNFGSLEFARIFGEKNVGRDVIIAETESLVYSCRSPHPGTAEIRNIKRALNFSAFPAKRNNEVVGLLQKAFPQFTAGQNVMQIGLSNVNAYHPTFTMFNAARIEYMKGDVKFYVEGATPSVVKVAERVDQERIQIGRTFGVEVPTSLDLLKKFYGAKGDSLYDAIKTVENYMRSKAFPNFRSRYIYEDIPMHLVPISQLGKLVGVETFAIDTLINMGSLLLGEDLGQNSRDLKSLGLEGKSVDEIKQLL